MRNKRGQAALEFLMTYGWAILVVLVVIGALAYFGVLNPNILVPEKCTMATGLSCKDYKLYHDANIVGNTDEPYGVKLYFENGMGKTIRVTDIKVLNPTTGKEVCVGDISSSSLSTGTYVSTTHTANITNGGGTSFEIIPATGGSQGCNFTNAGRKEKLNLEVTYYFADSQSTFSHVVTGEVLATVQ